MSTMKVLAATALAFVIAVSGARIDGPATRPDPAGGSVVTSTTNPAAPVHDDMTWQIG